MILLCLDDDTDISIHYKQRKILLFINKNLFFKR